MIPAQICDELSHGHTEFPRIRSQISQNDLEGQWPLFFLYQPKVIRGACLVQIQWFQLKSMMSYFAGKLKFTDRQTDGRIDRRMDAGNDNIPSAWKANG